MEHHMHNFWDMFDRVNSDHGSMTSQEENLRPIFHRNRDVCSLTYCYALKADMRILGQMTIESDS